MKKTKNPCKKLKKIGILGGMGPEATAELYLRIIKIFQNKYNAIYDDDFPEIFIYNLPLPDVVKNSNKQNIIKETLIDGVKKLESFGVDFIAIPCNTVNYSISDMCKAVKIPIINIAEETKQEIKNMRITKIGLLSTEMTIKTNIYKFNNLKIITPTKIIINILSGNKTNNDKKTPKKIIRRLESRGAEKVILGCTEISLFVDDCNLLVPIYDSNKILAIAAVKRAKNQPYP